VRLLADHAASAAVIADLERRKTLAGPGSGNRRRIRRALAKEWRKVRNQRRDLHHKTARTLVSSCDVIAAEDCPVHGVMDADVNGARNIAARAGLGSGQAAPAA
jgi:transposase